MRLFRWLKSKTPTVEQQHSSVKQPRPISAGTEEAFDPYNPFPAPVEIPLSDVLDLHTIPPRDVKSAVEAYLEQAYSAGLPLVRIIHGKGIGVQREVVRSILSRSNFVYDWSDAPPEAGGLGATIARFRH